MIEAFFSGKNKLISLGILLLMIVGIGLGVFLIQRRTYLKSRAAEQAAQLESQVRYIVLNKSDDYSKTCCYWNPRAPYSIISCDAKSDPNRAGLCNQGYENAIQEIRAKVGTNTNDRIIKLAVQFSIPYLDLSDEQAQQDIFNLTRIAERENMPLQIKLDGFSYWETHPELWNWWDPSKPGYNPDNKKNVEWTDWSPDSAIKISWRNWNQQVRVAPHPNLGSPQYISLKKKGLNKILPIIMKWYNSLPAEKKYLLAGVVFDNELAIGINHYYYPKGNDYVNRPANQDPVTFFDWFKGPSFGKQQLGYASVSSFGIKNSGQLTPADLNQAINKHAQVLAQIANDNGVPPQKAFIHGEFNTGENPNSGFSFSDMITSSASPGWTFYQTPFQTRSGNIDQAPGLAEAIDTNPTRVWEVSEWYPSGDQAASLDGWRTAINTILNFKSPKALTIYNWEKLIQDPNGLQAVKEIIESSAVLDTPTANKPVAHKPDFAIGVNLRGIVFYGQNGILPNSTPADRDKDLNEVSKMGAKIIRVFVANNQLSASQVSIQLDAFLDTADHYGLQVIPTLIDFYHSGFNPRGTDQYYTQDFNGLKTLNSSFFKNGFRSDFKDFVTTVVRRNHSRSNIYAWEIGNELKLDGDPQTFINFLNETASWIRTEDAQHLIATGMMHSQHTGLSPEQLYPKLNDIDVVTVHTYNDDATGVADLKWANDHGKIGIVEELGASGSDRPGKLSKNIAAWKTAGASAILQWAFMARGINDNGDGDYLYGMDDVDWQARHIANAHSKDYDQLFNLYKSGTQNTPPAPTTTLGPSNLQTGLTIFDISNPTNTVSQLANTKVKWARVEFKVRSGGFSSVTDPNFLSSYQNLLQALKGQGIKILGVLTPDTLTKDYNPQNPVDFNLRVTNVADLLVTGLGNNLDALEVVPEGQKISLSAKQLATAIESVYRQLRIVRKNTTVKIILGGIYEQSPGEGANYLDQVFSSGKTQLGWENYKSKYGSYPLDAVSLNSYFSPVSDKKQITSQFQTTFDNTKSVMNKNAIDKPLWLTEVGPDPAANLSGKDLTVYLQNVLEVLASTSQFEVAVWTNDQSLQPANVAVLNAINKQISH